MARFASLNSLCQRLEGHRGAGGRGPAESGPRGVLGGAKSLRNEGETDSAMGRRVEGDGNVFVDALADKSLRRGAEERAELAPTLVLVVLVHQDNLDIGSALAPS